eukprot:6520718-Prymnesium_polylepis.1
MYKAAQRRPQPRLRHLRHPHCPRCRRLSPARAASPHGGHNGAAACGSRCRTTASRQRTRALLAARA